MTSNSAADSKIIDFFPRQQIRAVGTAERPAPAFTRSPLAYDLMYADKDYDGEGRSIARFIGEVLGSSSATLLDVACGTGRHIPSLIDSGLLVSGSDLSVEMLGVAQQMFPSVEFLHGDFATVNWNKTFDVVMCLFGSIGYAGTLETLNLTVDNMFRHVRKGGVVMIEPWISADEFKPGTAHMRTGRSNESCVARLNTNRLENGLAILEFHHLVATPSGVEHFVERHEVGLFATDDYLQTMKRNASSVEMVNLYGDSREVLVAVR